jgi:hypothetical protein
VQYGDLRQSPEGPDLPAASKEVVKPVELRWLVMV